VIIRLTCNVMLCYVVVVIDAIVVVIIFASIRPIETFGDMTNQNLSIISEVFTNSPFGWGSKIHYIVFNFLNSVTCAVSRSHNFPISLMVQKGVSHSSQKTHPSRCNSSTSDFVLDT